MNGATFDTIENLDDSLRCYFQIPGDRIARVVCDADLEPPHYLNAFESLRPFGKLIVLPVDSSGTLAMSLTRYASRYRRYAHNSRRGDIIEVNEVNGDWTGPDSWLKAKQGIDAAHAVGCRALLTLYAEADDIGTLSSLWRWLDAHQTKMSTPDLVGISFYPRQSKPVRNWNAVYTVLGDRFPNAELIWSEVGDELYDDNNEPVPATPEETRAIISTYCGMRITHPRFTGGYLWWSFVKEMARGAFGPDLIAAYTLAGQKAW